MGKKINEQEIRLEFNIEVSVHCEGQKIGAVALTKISLDAMTDKITLELIEDHSIKLKVFRPVPYGNTYHETIDFNRLINLPNEKRTGK